MVKSGHQYVKYLICYDIENNRQRTKFADALKDLGLVRLQYSVFYGDLKPSEVRAMIRKARDMLTADSDRCFWLPCQIDTNHLKGCIGYKEFRYIEPDGHAVI